MREIRPDPECALETLRIGIVSSKFRYLAFIFGMPSRPCHSIRTLPCLI